MNVNVEPTALPPPAELNRPLGGSGEIEGINSVMIDFRTKVDKFMELALGEYASNKTLMEKTSPEQLAQTLVNGLTDHGITIEQARAYIEAHAKEHGNQSGKI